jgi:hypothetical protein
MENYVRFWRLFPRMALGLVFLLSVISILLGRGVMIGLVEKAATIRLSDLGNLTFGVIAIIFVVLLSSLGLFVLEIVSYLSGVVMTWLLKIPLLQRGLGLLGVVELRTPIRELALSYLGKNKSDVSELIFLKYAANPSFFSNSNRETISQTKRIRKHAADVVDHILTVQDDQLIERMAYFTPTQDRKWLEGLQERVSDLYYLQITLVAVLWSLVQLQILVTNYLLWGAIVFVSMLSLVPLIRERRKIYAFYVLMYYSEQFSLMEPGEDRDALSE